MVFKKILIIIIFIIIIISFMFSNIIDPLKKSFFGYNFDQSLDEIIIKFKKEQFDYKITKNKDFLYPFIEWISIEPKNQNSFEKINVDFILTFFSNKIYSITKYNISEKDLNAILNDLKNYDFKRRNTNATEYWNDNFYIIFQDFEIKDNDKINEFYYTGDAKNNIVIINKKLKNEVDEKMLMNTIEPVYYVSKNNIKLLEKPFLNSPIIRLLELNEKVEFYQWGDTDIINGKTGKWINVLTNNQEFGWIFSLDVDEWFYKIDYYIVRSNNVFLYKKPDINSNKIKLLLIGERLKYIEKGKNDVIDYYDGYWVKVKINSNEIGWCFNLYLEPFK